MSQGQISMKNHKFIINVYLEERGREEVTKRRRKKLETCFGKVI